MIIVEKAKKKKKKLRSVKGWLNEFQEVEAASYGPLLHFKFRVYIGVTLQPVMYLCFFHLLVPGFGYCLVVSWFYFYFPSFSSSVSLTDEEPKVWANFCYFETVLFNDFSKNSSSSPSKIFVSVKNL